MDDFIQLSGNYRQLSQRSNLAIFGYPYDKYSTTNKYEDDGGMTVKQWGSIKKGRFDSVVP